MGYKFQFVTLAGFHALNHGMFDLARGYRDFGMAAYSQLQEREFADEAHGVTARPATSARWARATSTAVSPGRVPAGSRRTTAMSGSTEARAVLRHPQDAGFVGPHTIERISISGAPLLRPRAASARGA